MSLFNQHGTTLSADGSNIGNLINITPPGFEREAVPTYDLSSREMTFRPSLITDYGELEFTVYLNDTGHVALMGWASGVGNHSFVIGFHDGAASGATLSFDGTVTNAEFDEADRDDAENIMCSFTSKVSGPWVWTGLA